MEFDAVELPKPNKPVLTGVAKVPPVVPFAVVMTGQVGLLIDLLSDVRLADKRRLICHGGQRIAIVFMPLPTGQSITGTLAPECIAYQAEALRMKSVAPSSGHWDSGVLRGIVRVHVLTRLHAAMGQEAAQMNS